MSNFSQVNNEAQYNAYKADWDRAYKRLLKRFLRTHDTFDGSAIAAWMRKRGLADPVHHNIWGTQVQKYAKQGLFYRIGDRKPTGASHLNFVGYWKKR